MNHNDDSMGLKGRRIFAFDAFDPVAGTPPDYVEGKFHGIVARARAVLRGRSAEEIVAAADLISWMAGQEAVTDHRWDMIIRDAEAREQGKEVGIRTMSEVDELRICQELFELDAQEQFPDGSWAELYAVLALAAIAEACKWTEHYSKQDLAPDDSIYPTTLGPYAVEAMEALCAAECELRKAALRVAQKNKIRLSAQKAALSRHAKTNQLNREFFAFYKSGAHRSQRNAAQRFYDGLPPERRKLLRKDNAVRTLTDALRAHLSETDTD